NTRRARRSDDRARTLRSNGGDTRPAAWRMRARAATPSRALATSPGLRRQFRAAAPRSGSSRWTRSLRAAAQRASFRPELRPIDILARTRRRSAAFGGVPRSHAYTRHSALDAHLPGDGTRPEAATHFVLRGARVARLRGGRRRENGHDDWHGRRYAEGSNQLAP